MPPSILTLRRGVGASCGTDPEPPCQPFGRAIQHGPSTSAALMGLWPRAGLVTSLYSGHTCPVSPERPALCFNRALKLGRSRLARRSAANSSPAPVAWQVRFNHFLGRRLGFPHVWQGWQAHERRDRPAKQLAALWSLCGGIFTCHCLCRQFVSISWSLFPR